METNEKLLVQLRTKLKSCKEVFEQMEKYLNGYLDIEDYHSELYNEICGLENKLEDLKIEMDLSDEDWSQDE